MNDDTTPSAHPGTHIKKWQQPLIGAQMLFVAFGALVLVPLLTGLNPSVALFTAGLGTLIFQLFTRRQVPVFLASSFAFIAPIKAATDTWSIPSVMSGLIAAGLVYVVLSQIVRWRGVGFIHRLLPPVVVGPVIMVIGLALAGTAVEMAMGETADNIDTPLAVIISMISLLATMGTAVWGRGLLRLVPILVGIVVGYVLCLFLGVVDFSTVGEAAWFSVPEFVAPEWNWKAVLFMIPVVIAPAVEHVGDMLAISTVTGRDYLKKPGLHRTLLGDGVATAAAGMLGGPPNTTYSEVIGAVTLTKVFNPVVMTWAAVCAILLAFVGKLGAALQTIPGPVMGGIMMLLFGSIAVVGLNTLVRHQVDLSKPRNMCIVSITLVFGIGGMVFHFGEFSLEGISLSGLVAIILNLLLPDKPQPKISKD